MGCPLSGVCGRAPAALVAAVAVAVLALVPTLQGPDVVVGPLERTNLQTANTQPLDTDSYTRRTLEFPCNGETCEAWLYMPKGVGGAKPPVVIMGHGMGGQKVCLIGFDCVLAPLGTTCAALLCIWCIALQADECMRTRHTCSCGWHLSLMLPLSQPTLPHLPPKSPSPTGLWPS